jgi:hypothetical protein
VIVAGEDDGGGVLAHGAGEIGVAEDVARAVDARTLAVPDAEDAIHFHGLHHVDDLAAHY